MKNEYKASKVFAIGRARKLVLGSKEVGGWDALFNFEWTFFDFWWDIDE